MKARAPLFVLLMLAAGLTWMTLRNREFAGAPSPSASSTTTSEPGSDIPAAPPSTPPTRTEATPPAQSVDSFDDPAYITLRGTFVVVDEGGRPHPHEQGTMRLACMRGVAGGGVSTQFCEVLVERGHWQVRLDALPESITVADARLGGRMTSCADEIQGAAIDDSIELRGKWLPTLQLRVVDEESGADLAGIEVVTRRDSLARRLNHPGHDGSTEVLVDNGRSPVRFEPTVSAAWQDVWVRAEDHAWRLVQLATGDARERVVRLQKGGAVEVTLLGPAPPSGSVLRVRTMTSSLPTAEFAIDESRKVRIESLAEGTWLLQVETGATYRDPLVLGAATVAVKPSTITEATITLEPASVPSSAAAGGTLRVSPAWGKVALEISALKVTKAWFPDKRRIELTSMSSLGADSYRWRADKLPAGDYQVLVAGTTFLTRFTLGPHGDENIDIVVPEPGRVRVRCVDLETGRQIVAGSWSLSFDAATPDWAESIPRFATRELPDGTFELLASPGTVRLSAHPPEYQWGLLEVRVVPGISNVVMQIRRACGIQIVLRDAETLMPLPFLAAVALTTDNGNSAISYVTNKHIATNEAGEFTLRIGDVPGYHPIPPRRVMVLPSTWTTVEIDLQKQ